MTNSCDINDCKQFLVLPPAKEVCAKNQITGAEVEVNLREGEILLNPGDIGPFGSIPGEETPCNVEYIREIIRIKKNIVFDDIEVVEGGKVIFNARLIKDIEFKVTRNPVGSEFTGNIAFKVVEIPFAGFVEVKDSNPGDKVKLVGFIDGELDRPKIGVPFVAVNEMGGEEETRLLHKLPGAVILVEKTVIKVCGEIIKKESCK